MDETLNRRATPFVRTACLAACIGATLAAAAVADAAAHGATGLQDPTRPPANLAAMMSVPGTGVAAAAGPQLQTILIARGAGGRQVAVIDGQTVRIGDAVQGARVTRIGENEVELRRGGERQVLRLYAQADAGAAAQTTDALAQAARAVAPAGLSRARPE